MNEEEKTVSVGEKLIQEIKEKKIIKDCRPDSDEDFHGGYEELYLYKFKTYMSSVSRYIIKQQLKEKLYK